MANRRGDIRRREFGGRYPVQQWLKEMVVVAINHGHTYRRLAQSFCGLETSEASTNNHNTRRVFHRTLFGHFRMYLLRSRLHRSLPFAEFFSMLPLYYGSYSPIASHLYFSVKTERVTTTTSICSLSFAETILSFSLRANFLCPCRIKREKSLDKEGKR